MEQSLGVYATDSINLYGDRFTVGALVSSLHDSCLIGIPSFVAHDLSRPLGWGYPVAVHMEPGLARLVGVQMMPETTDDRENLRNHYENHYYKSYIEPNHSNFEKLRTLLGRALHGNEKKVLCESVAFYEPDLAARIFPETFSNLDKDGLLPLKALNPVGAGVYQVEDLVLFAHYYFRRNLFRLNTLNYPILNLLQNLVESNDTVRLAIDPDLVGLASSYQGERMELQYWWGPKFDDDLTSITPGVTHHAASNIDRMFFGISATQFRWGKSEELHIFEAEELRDLPSAGTSQEKYGCRYVHSQVDKRSGRISHIDGAVRIYSEEKMLERIELNLDRAPRDTDYTKLWRVDELIEIGTWKRLLSDYFRDNYLIGEYLGAEDKYIQERNSIQSVGTKSLHEEFTPHSIRSGMGLRVALSYSDLERFSRGTGLTVVPLDHISNGESEQPYVESHTMELRKKLKRYGVALNIPEEVQYVSFRDFYVNFPLIFCHGENLDENLRHLLSALKEAVNAWNEKKRDCVVCYKFGYPIDSERAAIISVLGHVQDLANWFNCNLFQPPLNSDELYEWAEDVSTFLQQNYLAAPDIPPLSETMMPTGVLLINRKRVSYEKLEIRPLKEPEGFTFSCRIPDDEVELAQNLESEGIVPGIGLLIKRSRCSNCRQDYFGCDCSKMFDKGVAQEILDASPFLFWTDRPI